MPELVDVHNRRIDYLRVSVTDRCNLRCIYCMPDKGVKLKLHKDILTYEEIATFATYAVQAGISKIRLTGGEPLIRKDVVQLVSFITSIPNLKDLSLTTNGLLLAEYVSELVKAGLKRINVSIDSLDASVYRYITRIGEVGQAKHGLESALAAGLDPIKINVVAIKGINDDLKDFVRLTFEFPVHVRFIEYMPFNEEIKGNCFISCDEMMNTLRRFGAMEEVSSPGGAGPAKYFKMKKALGTLGFISPMSSHFCPQCNRLRLTADGRLRTCLFSDEEIDVRPYLRDGNSSEKIKELIKFALSRKPKDHVSLRKDFERKMFQIGG